MTRVLLDTNVVLDVLLERDPWVVQAKTIWGAHLDHRIAAHITATSLTDIFYLSRRLIEVTFSLATGGHLWPGPCHRHNGKPGITLHLTLEPSPSLPNAPSKRNKPS